MLSFPSLDDRSGFNFLDSEELPLLKVKPEDEFESFCLDLEEPLPFSVLELSDFSPIYSQKHWKHFHGKFPPCTPNNRN